MSDLPRETQPRSGFVYVETQTKHRQRSPFRANRIRSHMRQAHYNPHLNRLLFGTSKTQAEFARKLDAKELPGKRTPPLREIIAAKRIYAERSRNIKKGLKRSENLEKYLKRSPPDSEVCPSFSEFALLFLPIFLLPRILFKATPMSRLAPSQPSRAYSVDARGFPQAHGKFEKFP